MTPVEVAFRYEVPPSESVMSAFGQLNNVYGIRRLQLKEAEKTVCVEYDASRLTEAKVERLLRAAGFDLAGKPAPA